MKSEKLIEKVDSLSFKKLTKTAWEALDWDGRAEEFDRENKSDWRMAYLDIPKSFQSDLEDIDDDAVEVFQNFEETLQDEHGYIALIEHENNRIIVFKPSDDSNLFESKRFTILEQIDDLILERISNPLIKLRDYLTKPPVEKGIEYAQKYPEKFAEFSLGYQADSLIGWRKMDELEDAAGLSGEESYSEVRKGLKRYFDKGDFRDAPKKVFEVFGEKFEELAKEEPKYLPGGSNDPPTWVYMRLDKVIKNQWLIHLTNYSQDIVDNGFKYGNENYKDLSLTAWKPKTAKKGPGYSFAFKPEDFSSLDNIRAQTSTYGREAVIFRASGLKVWHRSDNEYQVIFWTEYTTDRVRLYEDGPKSSIESREVSDQPIRVGGVDFGFSSYTEAVKWIKKNYRQYRNEIGN